MWLVLIFNVVEYVGFSVFVNEAHTAVKSTPPPPPPDELAPRAETNESEYHPYHLDVDYDAQEIEMYDDVTGELIELYTDFEAYEVD